MEVFLSLIVVCASASGKPSPGPPGCTTDPCVAPVSFDCPVRRLALEFATHTLSLTPEQQGSVALGLNLSACGGVERVVPVSARASSARLRPHKTAADGGVQVYVAITGDDARVSRFRSYIVYDSRMPSERMPAGFTPTHMRTNYTPLGSISYDCLTMCTTKGRWQQNETVCNRGSSASCRSGGRSRLGRLHHCGHVPFGTPACVDGGGLWHYVPGALWGCATV
jgi:hypothetical protein